MRCRRVRIDEGGHHCTPTRCAVVVSPSCARDLPTAPDGALARRLAWSCPDRTAAGRADTERDKPSVGADDARSVATCRRTPLHKRMPQGGDDAGRYNRPSSGAHSSGGQSACLTSKMPGVRVPLRPRILPGTWQSCPFHRNVRSRGERLHRIPFTVCRWPIICSTAEGSRSQVARLHRRSTPATRIDPDRGNRTALGRAGCGTSPPAQTTQQQPATGAFPDAPTRSPRTTAMARSTLREWRQRRRSARYQASRSTTTHVPSCRGRNGASVVVRGRKVRIRDAHTRTSCGGEQSAAVRRLCDGLHAARLSRGLLK